MRNFIATCFFFIANIFFFAVSHGQRPDANNPDVWKQNLPCFTLNAYQLQRFRGKSLAQVLNEQPGIVVAGAYQPVGSYMNVYMLGSRGGRAMLLLNGIPLNDPSLLQEGFDLNHFPIAAIRLLEIYYGPIPLFFGEGAIAGVINMITMDSVPSSKKQLYVATQLGSLGSNEWQAGYFGQTGKWTIDLAATRTKTNGFSYAKDTSQKLPFDDDGFRRQTYSLGIAYRATQQLSFHGRVYTSRYWAESDGERFNDDPFYYYRNRATLANTGFRFRSRPVSVWGDYRFSRTTRDYYYTTYSDEHYVSENHYATLGISVPVARRIHFLGTINSKTENIRYSAYDSSTGPTGQPYPWKSMTAVSMGFTYRSKDSSIGITVGNRRMLNGETDAFDSYLIGLSVKKGKLEGSVAFSSDRKRASLYQTNFQGLGNPGLALEKGTGYCVGLAYRDRRLSAKGILAQKTISDGIDFNGNISTYDNLYALSSFTSMLTVEYSPVKWLSMFGNHTNLIGNETIINRENNTDTLRYDYLLRCPKNVWNIGVECKVHRFRFGTKARISGKLFDVGFGAPDIELEPFWVLDAFGHCSINRFVDIDLSVQNLLDNRFTDLAGYNVIPFCFLAGMKLHID